MKNIHVLPKQEQTKCYCGHTSYCDCGPEEPKKESLEEVAIENRIRGINVDTGFKMESFVFNAKQSKQIYTDEDMKSFADWCRNGLLNTEYSVDRLDQHLEQWKQFKKK